MDNAQLFQQLLRQTDPYAPYQGAVNALNFTATRPGQEATSIGVGLGKAILAGLLQGKSQARAAEQTSLANRLISELGAGNYGASVENLDPLISEGLKQSYLSDKARQEQENKNALLLEFQKGMLEEPEVRQGLSKMLGLSTADELPASVTSEGDSSVGALPSLAELKAQGYSDKRAREILETERRNKREGEQDVLSYEKEQINRIDRLPSVASLRNATRSLGQLANITDLNTASSDIPFATLFIGGLDGSVVREGEYDRVGGSNPILQKYANKLEAVLNGTSQLGVSVKKQMYGELMKMQQGLQKEAEREAKPYQSMFKKRTGQELPLPFETGFQFENPFKNMDSAQAESSDGLLEKAKRLFGGSPTPTPTPTASGATDRDRLLAELQRRGLR